jgi:predicted  nucleic acid-binding Zn-ribbon protein
LSNALSAAGVADLAEAKAQLMACKEAEAIIADADGLIAAYAPQGVEALHSDRRHKLAERTRLEQEFDVSAANVSDFETEQGRLSRAKQEETRAGSALDEARNAHQEHFNKTTGAKAGVENAERNLNEAKQHLDTARAEISDADLAEALKTATEARMNTERAKT